MTPPALLLTLAFLAGTAAAQETALLRRGTLEIKVPVSGTVVAEDIFRLKSSIDGRIESISASTGTWAAADQDLALLAPRELTAIVDAQGTTRRDVLEDRWKKMWKPTSVRCPDDCYILKSFLRRKEWVKPHAVLIEAARTLLMVGRVKSEDVQWIRPGQQIVFWPKDEPKNRKTGVISRFVLDERQDNEAPGGTVTMELNWKHWLPPGTVWEGSVTPLIKKNVLLAPTAALIRFGPDVFLPMRVSTGITTNAWTEITAGGKENEQILVMDDSELKAASRHGQEVDFQELQRMLRKDAPPPSPAKPQKTKGKKEKKEAKRFPEIIDPDASLGEDPYAE